MAKTKYKSRNFIYLDSESVWECIEMGRDIDELYPDYYKHTPTLKSMVVPTLPGEIFDWFRKPNYVITSFGRIYNCRYKRFLKAQIIQSAIRIHYGEENTIHIEDEFEKRGWEYDYLTIYNHYIDNNWNYRIYESKAL